MRDATKGAAFSIVVAMCSTNVYAQTTQPAGTERDDGERADIRRTMIDYYTKVLTAPDEASLRTGFAGTDEAFEDMILMRRAVLAAQRATAAVEKAFPEHAVNMPRSEEMVQGVFRELNEAPITIDGDAATLGKSRSQRYSLVRKSGTWQVTNVQPAHGVPHRTLKLIASLLTEVADEIEAGKYKSFEEVRTAMRAKQRATENASTRPTTAPNP